MLKLSSAFLFVLALLAATWDAEAQQKRASPHETISSKVGGNLVTVTYGRPFAKDRKIFGGLVPWGKAWRAGADEATTLITPVALTVGETTIPAGAYTLYLVPEETAVTKLAISKTIGKWGIPVDTSNDLARVDVKKDSVPGKVDQFTIAIDKDGKGGMLKMTWENTQFSVPLSVKK